MKGFIEVHDADQHGDVILLSVDSIQSVSKSSHGGCWINRKQYTTIHSWEEMDKLKQFIEEASK